MPYNEGEPCAFPIEPAGWTVSLYVLVDSLSELCGWGTRIRT